MDRSSLTNMVPATNAAKVSAMGAAYMMPSIPHRRGKMTINGNRKMICRVKLKNVPIFGFPMEVKKVDDMGWMLLMNTQNM